MATNPYNLSIPAPSATTASLTGNTSGNNSFTGIKPLVTPTSAANPYNLTIPSTGNTTNSGLLQNGTPVTVPKPTSVVSSNTAATTASNVKTNVIAPYDQNQATSQVKAQSAAEQDAATTSDQKFLMGTGKPNPNYKAPVATPPTPPTLDQTQIDELQNPGKTKLFNTRTGEQEFVDASNGTPAGYSTQNPTTRNDVTSSVQDANGNTIDQLSDGTYRRTDINGNYTLGTAQMFSDAQRVSDLSKSLDQARQGIYSPSQQSQLDSIQKNYQTLIDKQNTLNANTTGATTIAANRLGLGNQIGGQQMITKTVQDGIDAVTALTTQRDSAISQMKSAFETDDMNALKSAYDLYNTSSQQIQQQIDKTQATVQAAKDKQDLANRSNALTMGNKYLDTTDPILMTDTPAQVAEKVKTSPTWIAEQSQKAGQVDPAAVAGAYAIWQKTGALPTGFSAMSQNLKNAIYKKIGGNPDSVDQAVVNKAIIAGQTKALATQTNQLAGTQTSIKTLDKTLDLASAYSDKVDRTGSPFANKYALYLKGQIQGDADTTAFQALMKTAASEYAKIMNGSASSISGATVSSVDEAESIINAELSKGQLDEVMNILRKDASFRLDSQKDTISGLQSDIKNVGNDTTSSSSTGGNADFDW